MEGKNKEPGITLKGIPENVGDLIRDKKTELEKSKKRVVSKCFVVIKLLEELCQKK